MPILAGLITGKTVKKIHSRLSEISSVIPFGEWQRGVIEDFVPSLEPDNVLGSFTPELVWFVDAASVHGVIQTTVRS